MQQIITLTTDFGLNDNFTGVMKGVIYTINPDVTIVDINNNIERHNVLRCAVDIKNSYGYFPKGTIHLAVVDPGVGTGRLPLIVETDAHYFIGPDNGIFSYLYEDKSCRVFKITNSEYFYNPVSSSFHGRDIFAPVAAQLSIIKKPEQFGEEIKNYISIEIKRPVKESNNILGNIIYIDNFGNMITNIENKDVDYGDEILINDISVGVLSSSYSEHDVNTFLAIHGSCGTIEIALNRGNAADRFKVLPYVKIIKKNL